MEWKRVDRKKRIQPAKGKYSDWKEQIASDCMHRCVYCAIPDSRYGGLDNFHVEHFRPKSKFDDLENRITNLYLACAICNRFKSDDWPCEPSSDNSLAAHIDPSDHFFGDLFQSQSHRLSGTTIASRYIEVRLYLNRPQLIRLRRIHELEQRLTSLTDFLTTHGKVLCEIGDEESIALLKRLFTQLANQQAAYVELITAIPYRLAEVRRS